MFYDEKSYDMNEMELSNENIVIDDYNNIHNDVNDKEVYVIDNSVEYELELPMNTTTEHQQYHTPIDEKVDDNSSEYNMSQIDRFIEYQIDDESQELEKDMEENVVVVDEQEEINHIKNSNPSDSKSSLIDSADEAFCNYVAHEMKEMSKQNKNLLKRIITNFINEKNAE